MSDLYKVERITGKRKNQRGSIEYKVKWVGYSDDQSTWEPVRNLKNVQQMVDDFEKRNAHKMAQGLRNQRPIKNNKDKLIDHQKSQMGMPDDDKKTGRQTRSDKNSDKSDNRKVTAVEKEPKIKPGKYMTKTNDLKSRPQVSVQSEDSSQHEEEQVAEITPMNEEIPVPVKDSTQIDDVTVLYLDTAKDNKFVFMVEDSRGLKFMVDHERMMDKYSLPLIKFYESRLKFT